MAKQVKEVQTIDQVTPAYGVTVLRLINFLVGIVQFGLGLRFIFKLLAANSANQFVSFIYSVTQPLVLPFIGIFGPVSAENAGVVEWSVLVAMIVYAILSYILVELVTIALVSSQATVQTNEDLEA